MQNFLEELVEKQNTEEPVNEVKATKAPEKDATMDVIKMVDTYER